jgi:hypothetical protein
MTLPPLPDLAGLAATTLFIGAQLPMLAKAARTRDLRSYSLATLALATLGNALYWLYLAALPLGAAWLLHGFHTATTALMLAWGVRYRRAAALAALPTAAPAAPAACCPALAPAAPAG